MLEEMDSDCEIPGLAAINKNVDVASLKAARQQQQQQAGQKRKAPEPADAQNDSAAAGKEADTEKDDAEPAQAQPEIEQYEPGKMHVVYAMHSNYNMFPVNHIMTGVTLRALTCHFLSIEQATQLCN